MRFAFWLIMPLLFSIATANATTQSFDSEDEFYAALQDYCGDDLRCYFSAEELQSAFGGVTDFELDQMGQFDHFAEEDGGFSESAEDLFQTAGRSNERAPIWASFIKNFRACAPGCAPANYSTYGKRRKPSCHNTGKAVDVGSIACGGREYKAINAGKFKKFVGCMRGKMKTIYQNGRHKTLGHRDHAHFSNGCTLPGGRKYY